ncbi:unnamed protein product, partial [Aphanomyces euteiches]
RHLIRQAVHCKIYPQASAMRSSLLFLACLLLLSMVFTQANTPPSSPRQRPKRGFGAYVDLAAEQNRPVPARKPDVVQRAATWWLNRDRKRAERVAKRKQG